MESDLSIGGRDTIMSKQGRSNYLVQK